MDLILCHLGYVLTANKHHMIISQCFVRQAGQKATELVLEQNQFRISELTAALEQERQRISQQVQKGDVDQAEKIQSLTLALDEERDKAAQRSAEAAALAQNKA